MHGVYLCVYMCVRVYIHLFLLFLINHRDTGTTVHNIICKDCKAVRKNETALIYVHALYTLSSMCFLTNKVS